MNGDRARRPWRVTAVVLAALVLAAAAGVGGYAATARFHSPAVVAASPAAVPSAAAAAAGTPSPIATTVTAPIPTAATVQAALAPLIASATLGPGVTGVVADAQTGAVLFAQGGTTGVAPASTAKLLTAAAILTVHRPTDRFTTRVVAGPGTQVTLVGGGDPTLTAATAGSDGQYLEAARVSDLAAQVKARGLHPTGVVVDDSLFTGPAVSPAWQPEDVPSSYGAPITALMVDGARAHPQDTTLSDTPDQDAGHALAAALGSPQLPVTAGTATPGATVEASVRSAPISTLVSQMLQLSDNIIAEVLGRQVALAEHLPASFTGAAEAIRQVIRQHYGFDVGAGMFDASGLAAADRVSVQSLAAVLAQIASPAHPDLHDVLAGLPVAGWSGTLADRYATGTTAAPAAGAVRAKTGTLTGVSALAGVTPDSAGRLLVFAFVANQAPATDPADAALDDLAARLAAL